jgi:RimJ/RimL family protein N-acetyltransferase
MKHEFSIDGYGYRLRPVNADDAEFIVAVRLEDEKRNYYIHKISSDIGAQEKWIRDYLLRENDYYFIVENKLTQQAEGLISIYNVKDGKAEWGRWVIKKNSLAAIESVDLIFKVGFNLIGLKELYSQTVADNTPVVGFHNALPQKYRTTHKKLFELNGQYYDAVEHFTPKEYYFDTLEEKLETKSYRIFERNLKQLIGNFKFHHIGVVAKDIEKEFGSYKYLGYRREGRTFVDETQGISGLFIAAEGQPRLEILSNLSGKTTLDYYLNNNIKLYHFAYTVKDIDKAVESLNQIKIKIISPLKKSVYFKNRICFLLLPNRFMIELIEVLE